MAHICHATGCRRAVPPEMFACRQHWFALPKPLRDHIWATYRPGQCEDWAISPEYAEAAKEAVIYLARKDGVEPDLTIYEMLDPRRYE